MGASLSVGSRIEVELEESPAFKRMVHVLLSEGGSDEEGKLGIGEESDGDSKREDWAGAEDVESQTILSPTCWGKCPGSGSPGSG